MPFGDRLTWPSAAIGAVATKNIGWAQTHCFRRSSISSCCLPMPVSLTPLVNEVGGETVSWRPGANRCAEPWRQLRAGASNAFRSRSVSLVERLEDDRALTSRVGELIAQLPLTSPRVAARYFGFVIESTS